MRNLLVARFVRRIGISEISAVVTEKKKFIWQTRKTRDKLLPQRKNEEPRRKLDIKPKVSNSIFLHVTLKSHEIRLEK
ncbi:MAG TPA: hypothetical protein VE572_03355 [Nitrososphaeraceae archaeon]|nr:hypothetical protein [Nitrososphaeraceae archaeon]